MGSKLHVLAQVIVGLAFAREVSAETAAELVKKAGDEYKAGNYDIAAAFLKRAHQMEPKSETLFALAQAERLAGRCDDAVPHYKKLLAELKDLDVAKLVQSNLNLCVKDEPVVEPKPSEPAPPSTPPREIVRVERRSDKLATTLFATGMLGIGASVGLYIASQGNRDAAADANTLEASGKLYDKADTQRALSIVSGVVGLGLASYAVVRWMKGGEASTKVAIDIAPGQASFGYIGRW